jgi:cyclic-di-GMP-binding protein
MFGFGKTIKDPLTDAKTAERWLAGFPANDPLATHSGILVQLGRLAERDAKRTPGRLEAVFCVDRFADPLRKHLTAQYLEHGNRSTRVESQLWQSLFDLTQGFLLCYQAFAREVSDHAQSNKWQSLLPELIARQVMHHGLDAKIRLFRYEQWIPAKWSDLHSLFQMACSAQIERQPIAVLPEAGLSTIEQEYLRVLVLQLMNSGNLTPRHLEWVAEQLSEWCAPLRLSIEASTVTTFYVDLASRAGLKRRPTQPLEGRVLFLDTRPLHSVLMQNVVMLDQKVRNNPLSDRTPRRADQLNLLSKLASQVDPEFKPFTRRGERTSAEGNVDAIIGFVKIAGFLRDEELQPYLRAKRGASTFGESIEIATFGRMRNENTRTTEVARQRLASYAAPGGPWTVRDVSQTGFRLVAPMSVVSAVTLGTLAAIRPQTQVQWVLGIVRRMKRLTTERAEIGLQIIANNLVGVELTDTKRGEPDYSIEGEVPTVNSRRFNGLFLSLNKPEGEATVQTLVVPPGEYQPGKRLHMSVSQSSQRIAFGRVLEQHADWVWATVEPLAPAAQAAAGASS